ncbi:MAG: hypothetical protein GXO75_10810 [Calditrichaeota bacterium]|nr:hypothetical protein [Calditrichota bacterium]
MVFVLKVINFFFQIIFYPLKFVPEIWALIIVSVVTGIVMLVVFRHTSNQKAIKKTKDRIKAHILELVLYKDNFKIIFKAIGSIFRYNGRYLRQTIIPLVIVFIPVILILIQLNYRYQFRSFYPGERTLVKVKLNGETSENFDKIKFLNSPNYRIETPALRISGASELDWRVQILNAGKFDLIFENGGDTIKKAVNRTDRISVLSPKRQKFSFAEYLFCPTEKPIAENKLIKSIEILYPHKRMNVFGFNVHWLVVFFVVSLIAAFGLKGVFHVEI